MYSNLEAFLPFGLVRRQEIRHNMEITTLLVTGANYDDSKKAC